MRLQSALVTSFLLLLTPALAKPVYAQLTDKIKTKTRVSVSDATAVYGEPVTLSATVTVATGAAAVGMVKFKDVTAGDLLGSAPVDGSGVATLVISSLKPGIRAIRGTFKGSTDQASSSGKVSLAVRRELRRSRRGQGIAGDHPGRSHA